MPTHAVQLTARAPAAIAVILVAGAEAAEVVGRLTRSARLPETGKFSRVGLFAEDAPLDDAMLVRVGDVRFELHVHGGVAVVEAVLRALANCGASVLSIEEAATQGVFGTGLEGELHLTLPLAATSSALRLLLAQPGALRQWADARRQELEQRKPLWQIQSAAQWLLNRSQSLRFLLEPARVALIGPPNAGKSTLANALLGRPVSITSHTAGTTRDWVDAQAVFTAPAIDGRLAFEAPVILIDTAGIRETEDPIERESIQRTHGQARAADVIVLLNAAQPDVARPLSEMIESRGGIGVIHVLNKIDLLAHQETLPPVPIPISAKTSTNLDGLMAAVLERLGIHAVRDDEPFAFTPRLRGILEELAATPDVAAAWELLENVTRFP